VKAVRLPDPPNGFRMPRRVFDLDRGWSTTPTHEETTASQQPSPPGEEACEDGCYYCEGPETD